jgi:hypothetical protein
MGMKGLTAQERIILIRIKLERAKKNLKDFETQAGAFRDAYTHVVRREKDPKTLQAIDYFTKLPISKFDVLAAAGDVLQNLRSALDHLAFHLVEVGLRRRLGERVGSRVAFPIFKTANEYEASKIRKIKGARKAAIKAIDALKPYKRRSGNQSLWLLNYLNNVDKHRHIFSVASNYLFEGEGFDGHYWHKAAKPLFQGIFGPEVDKNPKSVIKKPLGKQGVVEGQPLFPFLREIVQFVDDLITSFEPHLRRRVRGRESIE